MTCTTESLIDRLIDRIETAAADLAEMRRDLRITRDKTCELAAENKRLLGDIEALKSQLACKHPGYGAPPLTDRVLGTPGQ